MLNRVNGICRKSSEWVKDEKGQGLVEYALILVLIAIVVAAAVTFLGAKTNNAMSAAGSVLVNP